MKHFTIITAITLITYSALFAQSFSEQNNVCYSWDSLTSYWNQTTREIFTYDSDTNVTSSLSQSWNGTAWENSGRTTSSYDTNGNQTSSLNQSWDGTAWNNYRQDYATYDANGNQTSTEVWSNWNGTDWQNGSKTTYTYNANGNQTSEIHQNWDGTSWNYSSQFNTTYDSTGIQIIINTASQIWNDTTSVWVNYDQDTYYYDINGKLTSNETQYWDGTVWINSTKHTYTYDTNGRQIQTLSQDWNGTAWVSYGKTTFTYDANGNQIIRISQSWNGTAWVSGNQENSTYDVNGNKISDEHLFNWNGTTWEYGFKNIYTRDVNGNVVGNINQNWNSATSSWENIENNIYTYDANGNRTRNEYQAWNGTGWVNHARCDYFHSWDCSASFNLYADTIPHNYYAVNMASGMSPLDYLWSWGDGSYDSLPYPNHTYDTAGFYTICLTISDSAGCAATYCDSFNLFRMMFSMVHVNVIPGTSVGIHDNHKEEATLMIFPNPAFDNLRISLSEPSSPVEIKIFNLIGELTSTMRANKQQTNLDISKLTSGIYILEIKTGGKIYRKKFLKGYF